MEVRFFFFLFAPQQLKKSASLAARPLYNHKLDANQNSELKDAKMLHRTERNCRDYCL